MGRQGQGLCPRQDAVGGVQAKDLGGGEKDKIVFIDIC